MKKLRLIKVPKDSKNQFINNVGVLRYTQFRNGFEIGSCIEPEEIGFLLDKHKHKIVGYTILNDEKYIVIKNKV